MTKKNNTWPNFSGFSAIIPMPAAPIPCCALPVPIRPPAMAIAAAIASKGFVKDEEVELGVCAKACDQVSEKSAIARAATSAVADNFDREYRRIS